MRHFHNFLKRRYGKWRGGSKYYIDCSVYQRNPKAIQTKMLLRNIPKQDVTIIRAVAMDDTIHKKNKQIVLKISPFSQKEYEIGELLYQHKISGFIRYLCIFSCYDDTSISAPRISAEKSSSLSFTNPICQASHTKENIKNVLIMSFIRDGSIDKFPWNAENIPIFKNLLMHTVLSLAMAYSTLGFIHGDLHLGNVLLKQTKQSQIVYTIAENTIPLETMSYKIILMDFEKARSFTKAQTSITTITPFWRDIEFLCKHVDDYLGQNDEYYISWENIPILQFLADAINNNFGLNRIDQFLKLLFRSKFTIHQISKLDYNPEYG